MSSLTVMVLTRNEAPRLARCLQSVQPLADELLVVDSDSTDGTADLAREFTSHVISRPWPGRAEQSNFARAKVRTEWFLHLDADEVSTPELNSAIRAAVAEQQPQVNGHRLVRDERFMGRLIRCGRHHGLLRLCRTRAAWMPPRRAHAAWAVAGRTGELAGTLVHEVDQPLAELLVKLTHRGLLSALDYHELGRHSSCASILWRPLATFLHLWLLKGGCLDGVPGLILAGLRAHYCFTRMVRLYELDHAADAS